MKTFKLSISVIVILVVGVAESLAGVDSGKTCQEQSEQSQPCIRETIEGCKTCTHWTYINECNAVLTEQECSRHNVSFDWTTGQCKTGGGWECYEVLDDNSGSSDCSNWSEWGQCSESCGLGFRERICNDIVVQWKNLKKTEKCQMRDNHCERISDIDDCEPNPCQHGGICVDGNLQYTCNCASGYGGDNCEIIIPVINNCDPNPCQNGGICEDGINTHFCNCEPGFAGYNCEDIEG